MKILVTGAAGFIAGYLVEELLGAGHKVVGLDNYSKYGPVEHAYDTNPHYRGVTGDAKDVGLVKELLADCDQFVAGAAIIGGISLFHELAYDLIAESERITARRLRRGHRRPPQGAAPKNHRRLIVDGLREHERLSHSRGRTAPLPASPVDLRFPEAGDGVFCPGSSRAVWPSLHDVRPFNCIGIGEKRALSDKEVMSGNIKLAMSHVVPDLVQKVLKGRTPCAS